MTNLQLFLHTASQLRQNKTSFIMFHQQLMRMNSLDERSSFSIQQLFSAAVLKSEMKLQTECK